MKLVVCREPSSHTCTIGDLYINGVWYAFTLEDVIRKDKIAGQTAIPEGLYEVDITHSPRFKCDLPLIKNVPNFTGVRIHAGNTDADTEGCILVGLRRGDEAIFDSRKALAEVMAKIREGLSGGVTLEIQNP